MTYPLLPSRRSTADGSLQCKFDAHKLGSLRGKKHRRVPHKRLLRLFAVDERGKVTGGQNKTQGFGIRHVPVPNEVAVAIDKNQPHIAEFRRLKPFGQTAFQKSWQDFRCANAPARFFGVFIAGFTLLNKVSENTVPSKSTG